MQVLLLLVLIQLVSSRGTKTFNCKNIVGFFDGKFRNQNPAFTRHFRFQFSVKYDKTNKNYNGRVEHWDESIAKSKDFVWSFGDSSWFNINETGSSAGDPATESFNSVSTVYRFLSPATPEDVDPFDTSSGFVLTETVGKCTKITQSDKVYATPDEKLYKHCVCCGDTYRPAPELGCPKKSN
ncbi:hypothetical protein M3Y97_01156300 [Aphelenchoides bicaudatus]|nr:hypothetical protein M3Y97_01156300 [Aphelenchoides bicaudatus]